MSYTGHTPTDVSAIMRRSNRRHLYQLIRAAGDVGVRSDVLFDALYGDDADGGPIVGTKMISTMVSHINVRLRPVGQVIEGRGRGHAVLATYKLTNIKVEA